MMVEASLSFVYLEVPKVISLKPSMATAKGSDMITIFGGFLQLVSEVVHLQRSKNYRQGVSHASQYCLRDPVFGEKLEFRRFVGHCAAI